MSQLEELQPNATLRGILPDSNVSVVTVQWFGSEALELESQKSLYWTTIWGMLVF